MAVSHLLFPTHGSQQGPLNTAVYRTFREEQSLKCTVWLSVSWEEMNFLLGVLDSVFCIFGAEINSLLKSRNSPCRLSFIKSIWLAVVIWVQAKGPSNIHIVCKANGLYSSIGNSVTILSVWAANLPLVSGRGLMSGWHTAAEFLKAPISPCLTCVSLYVTWNEG